MLLGSSSFFGDRFAALFESSTMDDALMLSFVVDGPSILFLSSRRCASFLSDKVGEWFGFSNAIAFSRDRRLTF